MTDKGLDGEANKECAAKVFKEHDTMENLWNSFIHNKYSAIKQPAIDANDYELEPALITMIQQNQFAANSLSHPFRLNKEGKSLIPNMKEMRIGILFGGILLNTTLDHLDLQREMTELKRAK